MNIVLVEPKMPANTGNIIRLCANTNTQLHLVGPLPFNLDDQKLRRAGLDYREWANVKVYDNWADFNPQHPLIGCSTRATKRYTSQIFTPHDWLVFGSEDEGISHLIRQDPHWEEWIRIPMHPQSRSLNLANSVSIIVFEALRQQGFQGLQ